MAEQSTTSTQITQKPFFHPRNSRSFIVRISLALCASAVGVWLLPNLAHVGGWALAVWFCCLLIVSFVIKPVRASRKQLIVGGALAALGLLPMLVSFTMLSFLWAICSGLIFSIIVSGAGHYGIKVVRNILLVLCIPLIGCASFLCELRQRWNLEIKKSKSRFGLYALLGWVVPIGCVIGFLILFSEANPLISNFFESVDLSFLTTTRIDIMLIKFMVLFLFAGSYYVSDHLKSVFKFFSIRIRKTQAPEFPTQSTQLKQKSATYQAIFGYKAIFRSLILFNILFLLQNAMDAAYLIMSFELPKGMTYASYAHRGAYPLVLTALLAAIFVLMAMRPGHSNEKSKVLRGLIYFWVAQNIALVASSLIRLHLYVDAYSLTYWRAATFGWMILVATGLILIMVRIATQRSNTWLIGVNSLGAIFVLYVFSLMNLPALIANYNTDSWVKGHSRLDFCYISKLGVNALPTLNRIDAELNEETFQRFDRYPDDNADCGLLSERDRSFYEKNLEGTHQMITNLRYEMAYRAQYKKKDWRFWDYRFYRLKDHLGDSLSKSLYKE